MKTSRVIASLRDQIFDIRAGIITAHEWAERAADAVAAGVVLPEDLADFKRRIQGKRAQQD